MQQRWEQKTACLEFEILSAFSTRQALTTPPASSAPLKTRKPQPRTASDTSLSSRPARLRGGQAVGTPGPLASGPDQPDLAGLV